MAHTTLQLTTPLSVAIAFMGSAMTARMTGQLGRYSAHRQTLTLTHQKTGASAELEIARAAQAASSFHIMIRQVTTGAMRRHVTTTLRVFVRETQAPILDVLAPTAA